MLIETHHHHFATSCRASGWFLRSLKGWCRPGRLKAAMVVWLLSCCLGLAQSEPGNGLVGPPEGEEPPEILDPAWGVGEWIWAPQIFDKQTCRLWRAFDIPSGAKIAKAQLHIGVDNGYRLMLDGRELGTGSDWRSITEYDIGLLLKPGRHVLAVEAFNDNREAGMQFGMKIDLTDGSVIEVSSDSDWRIVPKSEHGWETRLEASDQWARAVAVSSLLPREGGLVWLERKPTMVVRVPALRPENLKFWQQVWFQVLLWGVVAAVFLFCLRLMARLAVQSKAQAMLQLERARIARDIHDELGARLTELALEGEVIQTEISRDSIVRPKLEALCEKARAVSGAMDEVVWMVNSRRDTLRDFSTYACKYTQRFLASTPIRCRLDVESDFPEVVFELPLRRSLLLGVKEALNNAAKYSGATELFLRIHRRGQNLLVVVEDNGAGFDLELADPARNGLTNMKERMKELGGCCRINTRVGAGCRVEFQVPLPKLNRRPDGASVHEEESFPGIRGRIAGSSVQVSGKEVSAP
jgi:signal transduction histidine kinase